MIYVRLCRKCKKVNIVRNDNTWKDNRKFKHYQDNKLLCECDNK